MNRYKVEKQIGEGATADVWRCSSKTNGVRVIKFFKHEKASIAKESISNEAAIHYGLNHPGIIKLYEFGSEGIFKFADGKKRRETLFYMVEEYAETDLLQLLLKVGKMNEQQTRNLFRQLVDAVEYLHSKDIAHRDLKPENILIN